MTTKRTGATSGKRIVVGGEKCHLTASEKYLEVVFWYPDVRLRWEGWVPYEYRRTGVYGKTAAEKKKILEQAYEAMHPGKRQAWKKKQDRFWAGMDRKVTQSFFDALKDSRWKCRACQLPTNPNFARRIQDIKEFGYTLATDTNRYCKKCGRNTTHLMLLRLPRGGVTGYETWSPQLRKKILKTLGHIDAYENCIRRSALLPDHKFPEIRWGLRKPAANRDDMSEKEIKAKFQLLTNQRNQQKREVCRTCFQTGKRGAPYGIQFYYASSEDWPSDVPKTGKGAERGCVGCGWYDLGEWRNALDKHLGALPTVVARRR